MSPQASNPPARTPLVLLIEDDAADALLTRRVLQHPALPAVDLHVARDGVEGLGFLRREAPYENSPQPDLIVLDLNMPRKDGRETLAEIKADDRLNAIPVVVLTTSAADRDVAYCYKHQASCFVSKPVDLAQYNQVVRSIREFWFAVARLPPR